MEKYVITLVNSHLMAVCGVDSSDRLGSHKHTQSPAAELVISGSAYEEQCERNVHLRRGMNQSFQSEGSQRVVTTRTSKQRKLTTTGNFSILCTHMVWSLTVHQALGKMFPSLSGSVLHL